MKLEGIFHIPTLEPIYLDQFHHVVVEEQSPGFDRSDAVFDNGDRLTFWQFIFLVFVVFQLAHSIYCPTNWVNPVREFNRSFLAFITHFFACSCFFTNQMLANIYYDTKCFMSNNVVHKIKYGI